MSGQTGDAISANGVNQYASTPAINLSSTSTITVAMWVNRTYGSASTDLFENSANYNSSTTGFGFFPDDSADCGLANSMETGVHGNVGYTVNCYAQPTSGVWHHIAVIYDKTQQGPNVISLYLDGVLQTPTKQPISVTNTNAFGDSQLYLFSRGGTTGYAAGEMDDLRVYEGALTASQIEQIYEQGVGTLTSLAVTPANASIAKGLTEQYTAMGTYSNGSTQNLTSSVTWSSTNSAIASINSAGLATSASTGSTTIQATSGSISGSTGLTVTAPTLVSIAVTPANPSVAAGGTQQFTATGTYSDGSTQNLTSSVTWSSSSTAVATISGAGLASGVAVGSTTIEAVSGSVSGSTGLTVTPTLVSIAVTPANTSIATGSVLQFTATGTYSNGSTQNLTGSVTWSSSSTAAATISSAGLATGVAAGNTTIQATSGSISGSTGLTVTTATVTLVSIAVTPSNAQVAVGATQQYTATGTYSNGSTQNLTNSATWSSSSRCSRSPGGSVSAPSSAANTSAMTPG